MDKSNMSVNPQLCTGCACCQLSCSYAYTGAFNPAKARIVPEASASIVFTDECIPNCSICARYCAQGAIKHLEKVRV